MSSFSNTTNLDNLPLQTPMGKLELRPPFNSLLSESLDGSKSWLAKEECMLENEIIRVIQSGKTDELKPNSREGVTIRDHLICVALHEQKGSDYRVWEWHGHIMMVDEQNSYSPHHIYGNYYERLLMLDDVEVEEMEDINASSPRFACKSLSL